LPRPSVVFIRFSCDFEVKTNGRLRACACVWGGEQMTKMVRILTISERGLLSRPRWVAGRSRWRESTYLRIPNVIILYYINPRGLAVFTHTSIIIIQKIRIKINYRCKAKDINSCRRRRRRRRSLAYNENK